MTGALVAGLAVALGLMFAVWLVSLAVDDVSIVDSVWGPGFVVLSWLYAGLGDGGGARVWLVPILVTAWGLRLAVHIQARNRGRAEDPRYASMRRGWGPRFRWLSLVVVFWLQGALMWIVAMPLAQVQVATTPWSWLDTLGLVLFAAGFTFEVEGDRQLARFLRDPANAGRVMDRGLWRYTRHPNYFGDALLWWGLGCFAAAVPGGAWTLVGPALMTALILRVSGVTLLERGLHRTRPAYAEYAARTSSFIPMPPRRPAVGRGPGR
jgi:steroid 5-alpha reductase family enzyme